METKCLLPLHVADTLKCHLCHAYLSRGPIGTLEGKFSCGRCNTDWPRNTAYEALAQFMIFPCSYCEEFLLWRNVEEHELKCRQNIVLCPSRYEKDFTISKLPKTNSGEYHKECQARRLKCPFDLCDNYYQVKNLWQHFDKFHQDYIFTNAVKAKKIMKEEKVWNFKPDTQVCLIMFKLKPFLLYVHSTCRYDESTGDIISYDYFFSVFSLCQVACDLQYKATLTISSGSESKTFTMNNQEIKLFNERIHCINYVRIGLIEFKSFNFMTTRFEKLEKLKDLKLSYNIQFLESVQVTSETLKQENFLLNLGSIGKSLECPICKDYMCPPVYNCQTGHTLCKKCKEQLVICPFCQAIIGNSRNFVLEDILETLQISCQNEMKGCSFVGTVQDIKLHELTCMFN